MGKQSREEMSASSLLDEVNVHQKYKLERRGFAGTEERRVHEDHTIEARHKI